MNQSSKVSDSAKDDTSPGELARSLTQKSSLMSPVASQRLKSNSALNQSLIISNRSSVPLMVSPSQGGLIAQSPEFIRNNSNKNVSNQIRRSETFQTSPTGKVEPKNQVTPKKQNDEKCWLCRAQFRSLKSPFGTAQHNCDRCGNSVCEKCSSKIQLEQPKPQRVCNRCQTVMANEPIVQFYQGLQDSKERSIQTLRDRKSVIEMKNEHMKQEISILNEEIQLERNQAEHKIQNLNETYQTSVQEYTQAKLEYKNLAKAMNYEDLIVKEKRDEISKIQDELCQLTTKYEKLDSLSTKTSQEVNELLFLLQRYSSDTLHKNEAVRAVQAKYALENQARQLSVKRQEIMRKRLDDQKNVIWEMQHEFSVLTESQYEPLDVSEQTKIQINMMPADDHSTYQ